MSIAAVCLVAATSGSAQTSANAQVSRIVYVDDGSKIVGVTNAKPHTDEVPLGALDGMLPRTFPPVNAVGKPGHGCQRRDYLSVTFTNGETRRYPECGSPVRIVWLGGALYSEAGMWSLEPLTTTAISGANAHEKRLLRVALGELLTTHIARIRLVADVDSHGKLGVVLSVDSHSALENWEGVLVEFRYAALVRGSDDPTLRPVVDAMVIGPAAPKQNDALTPETDQDLQPTLDFLKSKHITVVSVERRYGAVLLTIRTSRPGVFLRRDGGKFIQLLGYPEIHGSSKRLPRAFFALENGSGAVVYQAGWVPGDLTWQTRADLDACGPIFEPKPPSFGSVYRAAPCPVKP